MIRLTYRLKLPEGCGHGIDCNDEITEFGTTDFAPGDWTSFSFMFYYSDLITDFPS